MSAIFEQEVTADQDQEEIVNDVEMFGERHARWYQIAAKNETVDLIVSGVKRVLVKKPTGAGKTFTAGLIFSCRKLRAFFGLKESEKLVILFIAHKHRLLTQAEREYAKADNIELILQTTQSSITDESVERCHLICLDEAHHESCLTIQYHLDKIKDKVIIGLTATPERADGLLVKFSNIVEPLSREQAVEEGWLAKTKLYSFVDAPERDKVEVLKDIFNNYVEEMGQTMVFVRTKHEVTVLTQFLRDIGKTAVGVLSQSERELNILLDRFSNKEIQFIVNCNRISEGVDVKFCESIVLGRTCGSYPMLNQIIGRASRPDSDCRVWELINPLSGRNLDTTVVVGEPEIHKLIFRVNNQWVEEEFDYTNDWNPSQGTKEELLRQEAAAKMNPMRR